ncbi:FMN reductase [Streptomyces sp. NPDC051639]|uniref:FMN reductase n=1 Tax=Streptomyces sp. NPDC051639 TaxID=3155671 RepID=UPI003431A0A0
MKRRLIAVASAGLRQPSSTLLLAERLAAATRRALERLGAEVDVESVELRDYGHHLVNNMIGYPSEELRPVLDTVARADGLIVVTPTFSASYTGLFKMFVDVLDEGVLEDKPVLMAATGGTARHSLVLDHAMRPLFSYLRAAVVTTGVFAAPEDWGSGHASAASLADRTERAAGELAREVDRRDTPVVEDPYMSPTPFENLLAGG